MTAADISALLGAHGHSVTRNAVIGIYFRNKEELEDCPLPPLHQAPKAYSQRRVRARRAARVLAKPKTPVCEEVQKPEEEPVVIDVDPATYDASAPRKNLMDLKARECRWPVEGWGADMLYCGHESTGSYCHHHRLRSAGQGTVSEQRAPRDLLKSRS